jgi:hypothetical protein
MMRTKLFAAIAAVAMSLGIFAAVAPTANAADCTRVYYRFDAVKVQTSYMHATESRQQNYNGSAIAEPATFTSTQTRTVGIGTDLTVSASAKLAIFAEVKATVSLSVSQSLTATISNSQRLTIPAHSYGYGDYGVWRKRVDGNLYRTWDCGRGKSVAYVHTYTPNRVGWKVWTSKT